MNFWHVILCSLTSQITLCCLPESPNAITLYSIPPSPPLPSPLTDTVCWWTTWHTRCSKAHPPASWAPCNDSSAWPWCATLPPPSSSLPSSLVSVLHDACASACSLLYYYTSRIDILVLQYIISHCRFYIVCSICMCACLPAQILGLVACLCSSDHFPR